MPASGLLPWLCPLPSLEQQQEVEGSGVSGDATPRRKKRMCRRQLSFYTAFPSRALGPTHHPQTVTADLEAEEHEAHEMTSPSIRSLDWPVPCSSRGAQPTERQQHALMLGPWSGLEFQNLQGELRRCGRRGWAGLEPLQSLW